MMINGHFGFGAVNTQSDEGIDSPEQTHVECRTYYFFELFEEYPIIFDKQYTIYQDEYYDESPV